MSCGTCDKFAHMLSNGTCLDLGAAQPAAPSARKFTFERAWRLRCAELHVQAQRADDRCDAARKRLVLADTILFAALKEPAKSIETGEEMKKVLRAVIASTLRRTMPAQALRQILAFCDQPHAWHDEQCTLIEFCAYIAVDVIAHIELAARGTREGTCHQEE